MDSEIVIGMMVLTCAIFVMAVIIMYKLNYKRVPPNKAMVVFGRPIGPRGEKGYNILTGGGKFLMPIVEEVAYLPLDVRNLSFQLKNLKTNVQKKGSKINIDAAATIKIASDPVSLNTAAETLLDKKDDEINKIAYDIIEGHFRGLIKTIRFDDIDQDHDALASRVQTMAAMDLRNVGMEIRTIVIKDVKKVK